MSIQALPADVKRLIKLMATCSPTADCFRRPAEDEHTQLMQAAWAQRPEGLHADAQKVRRLEKKRLKWRAEYMDVNGL